MEFMATTDSGRQAKILAPLVLGTGDAMQLVMQ